MLNHNHEINHDAQLIILNNITIMDFQYLPSLKSWENIFSNNNVNIMFNDFHDTYFRCFNACFSKKTTRHNINHNKWITTGIRKSCNRKRELFLLRRDSNDINLKIYFKQYCEILTNVILAAKKLHYCRIIANSNNK